LSIGYIAARTGPQLHGFSWLDRLQARGGALASKVFPAGNTRPPLAAGMQRIEAAWLQQLLWKLHTH
jgi:hypothetical protein